MTNLEMEKHGLTEEGRKYAETLLLEKAKESGLTGEITFKWRKIDGQICVKAYDKTIETPYIQMGSYIEYFNKGSE